MAQTETAEAAETDRETTDQWAERAIREHMAKLDVGTATATTHLLAAFARMMVDGSPYCEESIRALVAAELRLTAEGLA